MSEEIPAEKGNAAGVGAIVGVGGTTDAGSGLDEETDGYEELLASLSRTYDQDCRAA